MKTRFVLFVIFSGLCNLSIYGQYTYKPVPAKYLNRSSSFESEPRLMKKADNSKEFDITTLLPNNYVKDGSVDYTDYIQSAVDKYSNVVFPDFPLLVNEKGISVNSNSNLVFKANSKLIMKANNLTTYEIIRIHNVNNVTITNAVIVGDRDNHIGIKGEWGMGIAIRSSTNIKIINPNVSKCWGDGIYIGQLKKIRSEDISIYNAIVDANRRNGISITSGVNISLYSPTVSNTNGTSPMYGIDIEPNSNDDDINNILIENPVTFNNFEGGILIGLGKLIGSNQKYVNVTIKNHIDDNSKVGFYMGGMSNNLKRPGLPLGGRIKVINPKWISNATPFKSRTSFDRAPILEIKLPSIISSKRPAFNVNELKRTMGSNKSIIIN